MSLDEWYRWGLDVIHAVQQFRSPVITGIMETISFFGGSIWYPIIVLLIYWCIDSKKGLLLGATVIFSAALNTAIKETLCIPRPYQRDPSVFITAESGYSTPSGHSQGAAAFYPVTAQLFVPGKTTGYKILQMVPALLIPLIIGFSRIYLGVHYPTDVLLGLTFGFLTAIAVMLFWDTACAKLEKLPFSINLLITAAVCFILNIFSRPDTSLSGLLFGFCTGTLLLNRKGGFDARPGSFLQKSGRLVLGITVTGGCHLLLKILTGKLGLTDEISEYYELVRFIRYGVTGILAVYVVPLLFIKTGLASGNRVVSSRQNRT